MRQKTLLTFLLVIVILGQLSATGLVITYVNDRTLGVQLTSESIRYQLAIQMAQDGRYQVKAPPFLEADISNILHIGELQPQGLFTRLLDPMNGNDPTVGYIKGKNLVKNFLPSFNPKISGFSLSLENLELLTLGPLLNPLSPTGIGAILGNSKAYAAVLAATQNNVLTQGYIKGFQVNWKELGYGEHMYFSLLGATASSQIGKVLIKSGIFLQGAYDTKLGGGNTTGVAVEVKTKNAKVKFENKLGGVGVKLKELTEKANPQVKTKLTFTLGSKIKIFGSHLMTTYSKPIYGGTSQERTLEYTVGIETKIASKNLSLSSTNSTSYEPDKGKISNTILSAKAELNKGTVEISTQIHRPLKGECELRNTSLEFTNSHSNLQIKNKKIKLKLTWILNLSNAKLELSIDQNRRLSAQLEL